MPSATRNLVLSELPERGLTCASYPYAKSIAMCVGTTTVLCAGIVVSSATYKSNPLSVGFALVGKIAFSLSFNW